MCVSVIEVAEAAGEHNDFLVKPCPTLFDIPYLYVQFRGFTMFGIKVS